MSSRADVTGFVWSERYAWHDTSRGPGMPEWVEPGWRWAENPETKRRLRNLLDVGGVLRRLHEIEPRMATEDELARFHTREYIARIRELSAADGGVAGILAPFGRGSFEIACLAAGGVIAAVDAVLAGAVGNAYALVRPPGHHALADTGMGYCLFNNVVVAVEHAKVSRGLTRLAIVDWDVHHGNGTQSAFYDDPAVLVISVHQDSVFPPDEGAIDETGAGAGAGTTINIPLPAGSSTGAYGAAMARVVVPALRAFRPQLIVVSCGFDAAMFDPLGRMMLASHDFRHMSTTIREVAEDLCEGRVVLAHEGGYSEHYTPFCGVAAIEGLAGVESEVVDPFVTGPRGPQHDLQPAQDDVVRTAAELISAVPAPAPS